MVNLKRVLWHLLGGTRGGPLRIRVLVLLRDRPYNANQLATALGVDYKTVQHHLRVLVENRLLSPAAEKYGAVYFLTKDMEESLPEFDRIAAKVASTVAPRDEPKAPPREAEANASAEAPSPPLVSPSSTPERDP